MENKFPILEHSHDRKNGNPGKMITYTIYKNKLHLHEKYPYVIFKFYSTSDSPEPQRDIDFAIVINDLDYYIEVIQQQGFAILARSNEDHEDIILTFL